MNDLAGQCQNLHGSEDRESLSLADRVLNKISYLSISSLSSSCSVLDVSLIVVRLHFFSTFSEHKNKIMKTFAYSYLMVLYDLMLSRYLFVAVP